MNSDAEPPRAGEESGVRAPAEKNPSPDSGQLAHERRRLITLLENRPPPAVAPSPAPDPAARLTALARRLRGKIPESPGGDEDALEADVASLRALYADLLHNAGERGIDERAAIALALRAQRQALASFVALKKLQLIETRQNPPRKK